MLMVIVQEMSNLLMSICFEDEFGGTGDEKGEFKTPSRINLRRFK